MNGHDQTEDRCTGKDQRPTAEPGDGAPGKGHHQHGARGNTEQQQAQCAVINIEPGFDKRNQRRPGRHSQPGNKKDAARGVLLAKILARPARGIHLYSQALHH